MPTEHPRVQSAILEAFAMLHKYAREHVLLCLVPAFFIAGAVSVFVRQDAVMRYLGAGANKLLAYSVASVSGTILAVCSCTVLPLFAGIYTRGAGIGPATAFLYSGPAINILAIVMTARILGLELGVARTIGAIAFSVIIGLAMAFIYREEEKAKEENFVMPDETNLSRKLWQEIVYFATMVAFSFSPTGAAPWKQPVSGPPCMHISGGKHFCLAGIGAHISGMLLRPKPVAKLSPLMVAP